MSVCHYGEPSLCCCLVIVITILIPASIILDKTSLSSSVGSPLATLISRNATDASLINLPEVPVHMPAACKTVDTILNESRLQWKIIPQKFRGGTPKLLIQNAKTEKYYVFKISQRKRIFKTYKEIAAASLKTVMFGPTMLNAKGSLIMLNRTLESTAVTLLNTTQYRDKSVISIRYGVRILEGVRVDIEPDIIELRREGCGVFRRNVTATFTSWLLDMIVNNGDRDCRSNIFYSESKHAFLLLDFNGGPPFVFTKNFCRPRKVPILEQPPFFDKGFPTNLSFYCDAIRFTLDLVSARFPPVEIARERLYAIFLDDEWFRLRSSFTGRPNEEIAKRLTRALGLFVAPECVSDFVVGQTERTKLLPAFLADVYARRVHYLTKALTNKYNTSCQNYGTGGVSYETPKS